MKDNQKELILRLDKDLWRKIAQLALEYDIARTAVIVQAIENYFKCLETKQMIE